MGLKSLALWTDPVYAGDVIFDAASPLNRDDCLAPFRTLREALNSKGWSCHTRDVFSSRGEVPAAVLFLDIPRGSVKRALGTWSGKTSPFVILQECEVVKPGNWHLSSHAQFDGVFTWNDSLVDGIRYFKVNFSNHFPVQAPAGPAGREKLCVMIAGNKRQPHPLELYSERNRTIRWFEANHPEDFDLYGAGWDLYAFGGPALLRALNRIRPLTRILSSRYPSYRGRVDSKRPIMEKYRFSICYENARDIPGYITEKIFDSMFAGCVPVYWGAPDIVKYVPEECFIDRRAFATHEALYSYLTGMSEAEYASRSSAIARYLAGRQWHPFSDAYFARTIAEVVAGE